MNTETTVEKVAVDLPREVVRLLSTYEFIARVRDGKDKTPESRDVFEAVGMSELASPEWVRIKITKEGAARLVEWLDELKKKVDSDIETARTRTEVLIELDARPTFEKRLDADGDPHYIVKVGGVAVGTVVKVSPHSKSCGFVPDIIPSGRWYYEGTFDGADADVDSGDEATRAEAANELVEFWKANKAAKVVTK